MGSLSEGWTLTIMRLPNGYWHGDFQAPGFEQQGDSFHDPDEVRAWAAGLAAAVSPVSVEGEGERADWTICPNCEVVIGAGDCRGESLCLECGGEHDPVLVFLAASPSSPTGEKP